MSRSSLLLSDEPLDDDDVDGDTISKTNAAHELGDMDAVLAERLQLEELSIEDDDTAALALQYAEWTTSQQQTYSSPESLDESFERTLRRSEADPEPASTSPAQQQFDTAFPAGYKILSTPGTNFRCELYAMILSYNSQYASRTTKPSIDTLMEIVNGPQYRNAVSRPQIASNAHEANIMAAAAQGPKKKETSKNGENLRGFLQNDRYFSPDQLDMLLRFWGEPRGLRLRLGYVHGEEAKLLSRGQHADAEDVIWIHFRPKGAGHYSGMAIKTDAQKGSGGGAKRRAGGGRHHPSNGKGG